MSILGKVEEIQTLTRETLNKGAGAREIIDNGLLAGMEVVWQRFKVGDMFIPEVLLCARCMNGAMYSLKQILSK